MKIICYLLCCICLLPAACITAQPVRVAVAGISHGHSGWILGRKPQSDITLVGVYESSKPLLQQSAKAFGLDDKLLFNDLGKMLDAVKPEAVVAFGSIYDHLSVVQACAPRGIHVMVEKPLAVSVAHALEMDSLARKYNIHLLTNYETSWYPATAKAYQLINDSNYTGGLKKAVFHHGHEGPKEIGVSRAFLDWLTDPVQNGGGAIIDFGCYGANLMTWLMKGEQPLSVTAVTRQFKPDVYPKVDDEATIIVTYPTAQAIIQASWNWPFGRKDMELYGNTGYVITVNNSDMRIKQKNDKAEQSRKYTAKDIPVYENPFTYLADVVRKKITVADDGLYALPNNVTVVRILEAARSSAQTGKTVLLNK
ncbi:Gfo/Idh/MocA family oxidoreductase [Agriterribacter sp.]|uniref:Gfo/Idh/MocA family protein n=1 Tax=Agriterribacter sp. TaxID=2821509 RepID=UPI002C489A29|nr:Gfo/Idh/MocA family oxidoreductase [Agriterribacter sp.]HRO44706.1 Gfo/Idh/MocA family oxidoreductase [Agriterribacter sp.]HRQ16378.1 Gfo/Idh/MocA family oxidoreductase [Agriterribacter sp.]